ncbi:hypothetical protein GOBAR_DD15529 [Gossypium barbadense]|nr:hypothetical protein GOBAR_DD15529 [Gossypium barbadense]
MLDLVFKEDPVAIVSADGKKKKKSAANPKPGYDLVFKGEQRLYFLSSLLDVLLLKKDISNRQFLVGPLFKLIRKAFSDEWVHRVLAQDGSWIQTSGVPQWKSTVIVYVQKTLLLILDDIFASFMDGSSPLKDGIMDKIDVKLLVDCARLTTDGVTRNHVFTLLSTISKLVPNRILEHILDILMVIGESAVSQIDSHSQHVFEDLISAVVPCWLSKTNNTENLLQVFVNILPEIADHRRLSIVAFLLRILGEIDSLASLFVLLFRSLVSRKGLSCLTDTFASDSFLYSAQQDWEYAFAIQICGQYSCRLWLPSLLKFLQVMRPNDLTQEVFMQFFFAMHFVLYKLQDPEFALKLESRENSDSIQRKLGELVEQVVFLSQVVDARRKQIGIPVGSWKEFKACVHAILKTITMSMMPSTCFEYITKLLGNADNTVRKKALEILCETLKDHVSVKSKRKEKRDLDPNSNSYELHLDDTALEYFQKMCSEIVQIVDDSIDESNVSLKLAALSTLDILAQRFSSNHSVFGMCLASVMKGISSDNMAVSSSCLKTTGTLVNVLGPKALAELPCMMENVIRKSRGISVSSNLESRSDESTSILLSILITLEAVVEKLGGFLNPYLGDIIELMVLHPAYVSASDLKLKTRADLVRKLLTDKIPVRLTFQPLLKIYLGAVKSGDSSVVIAFQMLADLVSKMDRTSVSGFYGKIFDQCMVALDLRRQHPVTVQTIDAVEKSVINAIVSLTMKLTENMFKPLFAKSIEWAETEFQDVAGSGTMNIDRAISFYSLVNKLVENHRSLFVPYFKYLVKSCVQLLSDSADKASDLVRKKKKAKVQEDGNIINGGVSLKSWHVRALILSSLHKCFLHDTGRQKFLDSSNFQVLLKPIVSQLVIEPPTSVEEQIDVPSLKEVDDLLVVCIGQMAVTAGTDLLWKPLNHEVVLMQTRSEKMRARVLGLRIVREFLEKLKEEYLVLLPETIPFLGELLEDVELPVKSLAQDILKEMETMSGENLREYL